ncbi:hypothetical protein SBA1_190057 [Candidatus Sulfotelmatobacter kueseliae]|uniref:Uncharacterized protein n=1 Tax=Candidatus Sulfotelmatobacter kueseliae TaxID=2042962 RepID=A0A2U3KE23_9BACT|nr:hypothetical protein SBA1_190057 [Candidatus Sulfotelmatobacter kueseliae]
MASMPCSKSAMSVPLTAKWRRNWWCGNPLADFLSETLVNLLSLIWHDQGRSFFLTVASPKKHY